MTSWLLWFFPRFILQLVLDRNPTKSIKNDISPHTMIRLKLDLRSWNEIYTKHLMVNNAVTEKKTVGGVRRILQTMYGS